MDFVWKKSDATSRRIRYVFFHAKSIPKFTPEFTGANEDAKFTMEIHFSKFSLQNSLSKIHFAKSTFQNSLFKIRFLKFTFRARACARVYACVCFSRRELSAWEIHTADHSKLARCRARVGKRLLLHRNLNGSRALCCEEPSSRPAPPTV